MAPRNSLGRKSARNYLVCLDHTIVARGEKKRDGSRPAVTHTCVYLITAAMITWRGFVVNIVLHIHTWCTESGWWGCCGVDRIGKSKGLLFRIDSFFFAYNEHYNLHAIINNQNMLHTAHSPIINRRSEWCSYNVECRMQRGPLLSVCGLVSLPYVCFEWCMHVCMYVCGV